MATSKKTPAKKIAKRTRTVKAVAVEGVVVPASVVAPASPATTSVPLVKQKLVRDSFTMPKREYEQIGLLKARLLKQERAIKKGELLRAGIAALSAMPDADLLAAVERIQRLKTGRPGKSAPAAKASAKKKG